MSNERKSEKSATVLELGNAKAQDAHCLACGFQMLGGADVGLCPKCGSDRWYRTRLTLNAEIRHGGPDGSK